MNFSYKELAIYGVLAIIIVLVVSTYASGFFNPTSSVSVRLVSLNAQQPKYPYQISHFRVYINNTGKSAINNLVFGTYVNGLLLNKTLTLDLPAGTGIVYNFSYVYTGAGPYDFQSTADPGHLVNIENRSSATSSFSTNITAPSLPNVYTSVPNNNINQSQTFSINQYGIDEALFVATMFGNMRIFSNIVDSSSPIVYSIFSDLSPYMITSQGAYTSYKNGSTSYVAWTQGVANLSTVNTIIKSFGKTTQIIKINNNSVLYTGIGNSTSLCALYANGWTKLIEYSNAMVSSQTCLDLVANRYNATETTRFVSALKADPKIVHYTGNFIYANSSTIGSELCCCISWRPAKHFAAYLWRHVVESA